MKNMTTRYRLMTRSARGGKFYCVDKTTGKRTSLKTTDEDSAQQMVDAKNQAERQPALNYQIAKAYLAGTDNGIRLLLTRPQRAEFGSEIKTAPASPHSPASPLSRF